MGYAPQEQLPSGAEEPGPKSPPGKELEVAHSACSLADWGGRVFINVLPIVTFGVVSN